MKYKKINQAERDAILEDPAFLNAVYYRNYRQFRDINQNEIGRYKGKIIILQK